MFQLIGNICVNEMYTSILNSVAGILSVVIILTRSPLFIVQNYYKHTFRVYSYISYTSLLKSELCLLTVLESSIS